MTPTPAQAEKVILHNRDDSRSEFRELILYPYGRFAIHRLGSVGSPSNSAAKTQYQLQIGSKSEMQLFLKSEVERLCDERGFALFN